MVVGGAAIAGQGGRVAAFAKNNPVKGSGNYKFPDANEIAKRLGVDAKTFHKEIKPQILGDENIASFAKKIGADNPDIGINSSGNIVLKNPINGKTIDTDIPLSDFEPSP